MFLRFGLMGELASCAETPMLKATIMTVQQDSKYFLHCLNRLSRFLKIVLPDKPRAGNPEPFSAFSLINGMI